MPILPPSEPRPCPVCGEPAVGRWLRVNVWDVLRCRRCTVAFVPPPPDSSVAEFYRRQYASGEYGVRYAAYDPRRRASFQRWLDILAHLKPSGSLLDVGAATGEFLSLAAARGGWVLSGVEINPQAAALACLASGADVRAGDVTSVDYPDRSFDVITAWELLEHLPDPAGAVGRFHRWLKPDGVLAVSTPNLNKLKNRLSGRHLRAFFIPPEHLFYFNRRALVRLMRRSCFVPLVVDAGVKSPLHRLGLYNPGGGRSVPAAVMEAALNAGRFFGVEGFQIFAVFGKLE